MRTSLMNHVAGVYFRLQPKPSEAAWRRRWLWS